MTAAGTPLAPGTRLGPYEIVDLIGSGGMADVYRGHDTRLNRIVAIKVLGAHAADTRERRARLDREARAVSVLSHPNVCVLYDVGLDDDRPFLVMEYVAGETLAQRLRRGPLPLRDALRIAIGIADALDHAHRQGVIHRDLKPANVMLPPAGVKLVDFGLARLREPECESPPTNADETESISHDGVLLGTLPYMSPEQVEAKQADSRSDLFALGAILYEMLTARRAFDADSKAGLIVSILERDPPPIGSASNGSLAAGGSVTTSLVEHVVARCLAKQPDERWQSASDLRRELQWISLSEWAPAPAPAPPPARPVPRVLLLAGIIAAVALAGWGASAWRAATGVTTLTTNSAPVTFTLTPPAGLSLVAGNASPQMVVSPDGTWIAYGAGESDLSEELWVTHLSDNVTRALPHTDGAKFPFWAPDSRSLAYFSNGKLFVTRLDSASSVAIADAPIASGGAWGADDIILFDRLPTEPLMRVSAKGGSVAAATSLDASRHETSHEWPMFLPDGRHYLFYAASTDKTMSGICLASLDAAPRRWLLQSDVLAEYARGSLLFGRDGTLLMQPLDVVGGTLTGDPAPIATNVAFNPFSHRMAFSASDSTLVYREGLGSGSLPSALEWRDRRGQLVQSLAPPDWYIAISISPDGKSAAVTRGDGDASTLWLFDAATGRHRVLADRVFPLVTPTWSPDSSAVAYTTAGGFVRTSLRDGSQIRLGRDATAQHLTSWAPDGRTILYGVFDPHQSWNIWQLSLDGAGEKPFLVTGAAEGHAQFSPDGRWVLYVSDASGKQEVLVTEFGAPSTIFKISDGGGYNPLWRGDGRALYYLNPHRQLVEVDVSLAPTFHTGASRTLFPVPVDEGLSEVFVTQYAVARDGQQVLVKTPAALPRPMIVRVNWGPIAPQ